MNPNATDTDLRQPLAAADLLLLLAGSLDRPGASPRHPPEIHDQDLEELACCAGLTADPDAAVYLDTLKRIVDAPNSLDPAAWADEHSRLFDGPILCPPNETAYVRRDKGAILADICGFYTAFGFRLSDASGEKADHLISELEFLALLLVMLSEARRRGSLQDEEVTLQAVHAFASEHLDEWVPLFVERLEATTALPLYRDVARALRQTWKNLLATHGIEPAGRVQSRPPEAEPGTPYECGMPAPTPGDTRA